MTRHLIALVALSSLSYAGCNAAPPAATTAVVSPAPGAPVVPAVPDGWSYPLATPGAEGVSGMVVSDQALATEAGVAVLREGGNAVDAAVATAFALAVVLPSAGNIGGGGFMVAHIAGERYALDFRETAPAAASRDMYLDAPALVGRPHTRAHRAAAGRV